MPIDHYDPAHAPTPDDWLALPEDDRLALIQAWHEAHDDLNATNPRMHAIFHRVVEDQIALSEPPFVAPRLRQLMTQGLDRHDAIHAIISVLANRMRLDMRRSADTVFQVELYQAGLRRLNARNWRRGG